MYFSAPGPAGPCRFSGCVSFSERETRILGSSKQVINKDFFSDGISITREIKVLFTANGKREFVPRDQVSLFLSFTVHHYFYRKMCSFMPVLSISIILESFLRKIHIR